MSKREKLFGSDGTRARIHNRRGGRTIRSRSGRNEACKARYATAVYRAAEEEEEEQQQEEKTSDPEEEQKVPEPPEQEE